MCDEGQWTGLDVMMGEMAIGRLVTMYSIRNAQKIFLTELVQAWL